MGIDKDNSDLLEPDVQTALMPRLEDPGAGPGASLDAPPGREDCLLVLHTRTGQELGKRLLLRSGLTIGREGCDVSPDLERISRRHCELVHTGRCWMIRDLHSTNGPVVNGRRIDEVKLSAG